MKNEAGVNPLMEDDLKALAAQLLETLSAARSTIAVAESCTGGLLAALEPGLEALADGKGNCPP